MIFGFITILGERGAGLFNSNQFTYVFFYTLMTRFLWFIFFFVTR